MEESLRPGGSKAMDCPRTAAAALTFVSFCAALTTTVLGEAFVLPAAVSLALTVPTVLATVIPRLTEPVDWTRYAGFALAPLFALAAYHRSALDAFVVAWAMAPWIFVPLFLLDEAGLVAYPVSPGTSMVQRMLFYAAIRALAVAAARRSLIPALFARTLLLCLGTVETFFMFLGGKNGRLWYNFPVRSLEFATYAIVKSVWLLGLPLLEEVVLAALS